MNADPRLLGRIKALLQPWWTKSLAPIEVRFFRGFIHQHEHRFADSLVDIESVLIANPRHNSARFLQISIQQILGDFKQAETNCRQLRRSVGELVGIACVLWQQSFQGNLKRSFYKFKNEMVKSDLSQVAVKVYFLSALADMAMRQNELINARKYWHEVLTLSPSPHVHVALADVLLAQKDYGGVLELLSPSGSNESMLLRLAIAAKRLGHPDALRYRKEFESKIVVSRLRGDNIHHREEALYQLEILGDVNRALHHAKANWESQKEPIDIRILAQTATVTGNHETLAQLKQWIQERDYEDAILSNWLR